MNSIIIITMLDLLFIYTALFELQMLQQNSYNEKGKFYHYIMDDIRKNYKVYLLKYLFAISLLLFRDMSIFLFIYFIFSFSKRVQLSNVFSL